jgi:solute:Na+ symporter, SSS family
VRSGHFNVQQLYATRAANKFLFFDMQNLALLFFIGLYMVGTVLVGWWASRRVKSAADFVMAGKQLPMFVAACALFATWFGSETVMGASSEFVEKGVPGIIEDPFGAALCLALAGLLVARPLYKLNLLTFSDYFRLRFNKVTEVVSAFFMVPSYFSWIAAQLVALAILLQTVSGLERQWGVMICASLVLCYTYIGGMWSVAITDFVQTIVIIVGLLVLAIDIVWNAGGFGPIFAKATADKPDFFRFWPEPTRIGVIEWTAALMTIGLGSIPQQDVFQRVMGARSERASVRACYTSSVMYLSVAFLPLMICLGGSILYPELKSDDLQELLPTMVLSKYGLGMQVLFFGALLSAILSTASGAMLAPATVIGENLVKPLYKDLTDQQLLRIMRISLVAVAIITAGMALWRQNIYELVGESSALSLVSLFVPLIGGLYWKRATAKGAVLSMILGMAVWLLTLWLLPKPAEDVPAPTDPTWGEVLTHVPPMLWGLFASIFGMIVGSLADKPAKQ